MATTGSANGFVLNIVELQNVITSAGGQTTNTNLSTAVANIQQMVLFDTKQIKADKITAFTAPPIQTDPLNVTSLTITGGSPGIGKYLTCTDTLGSAAWTTLAVPSDANWKRNIQPLSNADQILSGLAGFRYEWIDGRSDVGVLAQDVEKVLPEAFVPAGSGPAAVEYHKIIPVLVEVVKGLQSRVKALEALTASNMTA
jgi:Chaperone of endosialidase